MDGYKILAAAIVERAVLDYKDALKIHDEGSIKYMERFFRSDWFMMLSDCDGESLIRKVKWLEVKV